MYNQGGQTALFYAAEGGYLPVVELLLKKGADIEVQNKVGNVVCVQWEE